ncbi:hypothetical protein AWC38_SpisGene15571 [Stylophora pistillata]|uniref:C3H1-type domain-containing protein n=1 Tax=Stylophora pistillata TaxID=50429 RepID=A0A2B4RUL0_STYPI|nr:hypothetical protein AWC38_SpisGene15571 [Stylophora pistillata]
MDDLLAEPATPLQISEAVKRELSQVESIIQDLSPKNRKFEQPAVEQDRTIADLRNHNLQLELDLTRTILELLKLQRDSARNSCPTMVATEKSTKPDDNPTAKPTLKDLHQHPNGQLELKSLMDSLGDPILEGLTEEEQDPRCQLLEPTTSRASYLPPRISAIILHSSKISELAKCYPLPKVMQYDDLYLRMQFATNCKWGTDSQFISHQTLHRPDSFTVTTTRSPPRKPSRPVINPATGKQVCYDFQWRKGCRFDSSCRYDHVCIKPQCLGTHPQWQHQSAAIQDPPIVNPHSSAEISLNFTLTEELSGDISSISLHAGNIPPFTTHHPAECGESPLINAGPLSESMQQPKAAQVSTDLIFETWASELLHGPEIEFIQDSVQHGFHLLPPDSIVVHAFTQNNKSALRPSSKDQIEVQLVKGLQQDHFGIADHSHMPTIINALGAVPKKDSDEVRMIMDYSRPSTMNANSYIDLDHYKYVTVDDAANLCQPGCWLAKVDFKHAYRSVGYTVLAYLDDNLIIEPTQLHCKAALDMLLSLMETLGFTINWIKVVYPAQCLTFLGVEIDTVKCELRLPADRMSELLSLCKETTLKLNAPNCTFNDFLGSLTGQHVLSDGGRIFLRQLITLANSAKRSYHRIYLNLSARADLLWWTSLLPAHNCKTLSPSATPELHTPVLTDASLSGGGCVWDTDLMYVNWALDNPALYPLHINYKETFTIVLAAHRWAPLWSGYRVVIKFDSQVAAAILNKGSSRCPLIMAWIRSLFWLQLIHLPHSRID